MSIAFLDASFVRCMLLYGYDQSKVFEAKQDIVKQSGGRLISTSFYALTTRFLFVTYFSNFYYSSMQSKYIFEIYIKAYFKEYMKMKITKYIYT